MSNLKVEGPGEIREMDPEVWKHLPDHEEILRLVLARLPWWSNTRLRLVSKLWNSTLSEPSFLTWGSMLTDRSFFSDNPNLTWSDDNSTQRLGNSDTRTQGSAPSALNRYAYERPVCLLSTTENRCAVANFLSSKWSMLPPLLALPFGRWAEFTVSGATEGLLLLERNINLQDRHQDLYTLDRYLFNPVNNSWRKLPDVPRVESRYEVRFSDLCHPLTMAVDKDDSVNVLAFEFLHLGNLGRVGLAGRLLQRIYIYSLSTGVWKPTLSEDARFNQIRTVDTAVFADDLYIHTRYQEDGSAGHRLFRTSTDLDDIEVNTDFLHDYPTASVPVLHFFQHRGKLMYALGTWKCERTFVRRLPRAQGIRLGRFDHRIGKWQKEVVDMPQAMAETLYSTLPDNGVWRFYFDVERDTICFGNRMKSEFFVLYNLCNCQWSAGEAQGYERQNESNQGVFLWEPRKAVVL